MFRPIALFLGYRYIKAKRTHQFMSLISRLSMWGLSLGVAILIIVMSVMNGFDQQLKTRILGRIPHAILQSKTGSISNWPQLTRQLQTFPGIISAAPLTRAQCLMSFNEQVSAIWLNGIDPNLEPTVSILGDYLKVGTWQDLKPGSFNLLISNVLAEQLDIRLGDKITITRPSVEIDSSDLLPAITEFTVIGFLEAHNVIEESLAYIHWQDANTILNLPLENTQSIRLKVNDLFQAATIANQAIQTLKAPYQMTDWSKNYGQLFSAVRMEKMIVGLLLSFLIAMSAFNLICTLAMSIHDKRSDIAILKTMGCSSFFIMCIFITQGMMIGVIGIFFGLILGLLGAYYIDTIVSTIQNIIGIQVIDPSLYYSDFLPSDIQCQDIYIILLISLALCSLATLYPAWRASRISPADVLKEV